MSADDHVTRDRGGAAHRPDPAEPRLRAPTVPAGCSPAVLERPDGGWQVGVGPGAVVLRADPDELPEETRRTIGQALAGLGPAGAGRHGQTEAVPGPCAVHGAGPLAARLRRALGEVSPEDHRSPQVLVHQHVTPPEVGVAVARSGRTTVPIVVQHRRVLVGPVVGPGPGPCLHCLDLHRRDRDSAWPVLAAALGHPAEQVDPVGLVDPLARAAEGLVLLLVSSVQAGGAVSPGLAYELGRTAPHLVARRWTIHPACSWHG